MEGDDDVPAGSIRDSSGRLFFLGPTSRPGVRVPSFFFCTILPLPAGRAGYTPGPACDVAGPAWAGRVGNRGDLSLLSLLLRPPSVKTFTLADALAGIPRCLFILEAALIDLLRHPEDETRRASVRELTRTLSAGCPECGFHASSATLRKIESLLRVPPKAAPELQKQIADKLIELVGMLMAEAQTKGKGRARGVSTPASQKR